MVSIDDYREGDLDALCGLFRDWGEDFSRPTIEGSIGRVRQREDYRILVARDGDKVVGYVQTGVNQFLGHEPHLEVIQLLVAEDRRSEGVGAALMECVEGQARAAGITTVRLHSQVRRSRAHVFYERLGYSLFKISKFYEKRLE